VRLLVTSNVSAGRYCRESKIKLLHPRPPKDSDGKDYHKLTCVPGRIGNRKNIFPSPFTVFRRPAGAGPGLPYDKRCCDQERGDCCDAERTGGAIMCCGRGLCYGRLVMKTRPSFHSFGTWCCPDRGSILPPSGESQLAATSAIGESPPDPAPEGPHGRFSGKTGDGADNRLF